MVQSGGVPWWKKTVVYQIYPRSFQDSNGDGVGDIPGIISRLDYLKNLGVETLWFSPFYTSPQKDFGYDISDYTSIAPEYGNMADCDQLISEIHSRDMKIVLDLVLNHTSDEHQWFRESRSSPDNPKRDWYVWRDGKRRGKPPNNWKSLVTGSGWHYDENTDQWYWAAFLPFQPDLNWRNPEVKQAMFDVMRFWLDKGADGFRLDIIGSVYEDERFRNNPVTRQFRPTTDERGMLFRSSKRTVNIEENFEFVKELRALVDGYDGDRFLVGEAFGQYPQLTRYCGGKKNDGLNTVFLFQTMETKFTARGFRRLISEFEGYFADPLIPTWVFSNHDRYRNIRNLKYDIDKAKLLAGLQLTARGVPYIYYGEEIGLEQVDIPVKDGKDALALKFAKYPGVVTRLLMRLTNGAINRDGCRTPMQWNASSQAGFTNSQKAWLPFGVNKKDVNVESQLNDPDSLLTCYRNFLEVRKQYPALHQGDLELIDYRDRGILVYDRYDRASNGRVRIIANFNNQELPLPTDNDGFILSSLKGKQGSDTKGYAVFRPYELMVFEMKRD